MDIDGVEVVEEQEEYGFSWRWDDPRGFQSEILWNREVGHLKPRHPPAARRLDAHDPRVRPLGQRPDDL
jgi:hypothetical protein